MFYLYNIKQMKKPKPCITLCYDTPDIWEHARNVENTCQRVLSQCNTRLRLLYLLNSTTYGTDGTEKKIPKPPNRWWKFKEARYLSLQKGYEWCNAAQKLNKTNSGQRATDLVVDKLTDLVVDKLTD